MTLMLPTEGQSPSAPLAVEAVVAAALAESLPAAEVLAALGGPLCSSVGLGLAV
jgi:hypothetical protein